MSFKDVVSLELRRQLQERIVFKNIYNFLIDNNLLDKHQSYHATQQYFS